MVGTRLPSTPAAISVSTSARYSRLVRLSMLLPPRLSGPHSRLLISASANQSSWLAGGAL